MERGGGDISSEFSLLDKISLSNSDFVTSTKLQICTEADRGGANEVGGSNIYRDGGGSFGQTFNIFPSTISYGGMMGFPFTGAQLKELERQALIYKYMISSVPVPLHLLPQLSRNFPETHSSLSCKFTLLPSPFFFINDDGLFPHLAGLKFILFLFLFEAIYSGTGTGTGRYSKNGDPEPGRCKRTDGKKWRCSKEVAPQQKYCERHLHRGRPRSRKPVENHKKKSLPTAPNLLLNAKTDLTISTPPYYNREGKIEQPWENIMKSNCYIPQEYVEEQQPLDAFCYPNMPFTRNMDDGDLSPSLNLSMAMAAGNMVDREMRNIQMVNKSKDSMWVSPGPFLGPLGEALTIGGSTPASPYNSINTPATSPSGVLHWTLFSQSDSSVCSSPTFVAPPSEGSNQWHN